MNIQHSSRTDLWFTPLDIILRAKRVLGDIDLDPASQAEANMRVGATHYFTREMDGLAQDWAGYRSIFVNPPGGKRANKSMTQLFWQKLIETRSQSAAFEHAIFLAFSLEAAQTTQKDGHGGCLVHPFCVPSKRIAFDDVHGRSMGAPSHSNVIVYVPGSVDRRDAFALEFAALGVVRR